MPAGSRTVVTAANMDVGANNVTDVLVRVAGSIDREAVRLPLQRAWGRNVLRRELLESQFRGATGLKYMIRSTSCSRSLPEAGTWTQRMLCLMQANGCQIQQVGEDILNSMYRVHLCILLFDDALHDPL